MKSAIIYYSRSGITKDIAEKLKNTFGSDMYFVEPEKAYGNYLSAVLRNGTEKLRKKIVGIYVRLERMPLDGIISKRYKYDTDLG